MVRLRRHDERLPTNWLWLNNPVTALGAGGLLAFAVFILVRAIVDYAQHRRGEVSWWSLKLGAPAISALVSVLVLCGWLTWVSLPILWSALFVLIAALIVTALLRIVAESGVFWTQWQSLYGSCSASRPS